MVNNTVLRTGKSIKNGLDDFESGEDLL